MSSLLFFCLNFTDDNLKDIMDGYFPYSGDDKLC